MITEISIPSARPHPLAVFFKPYGQLCATAGYAALGLFVTLVTLICRAGADISGGVSKGLGWMVSQGDAQLKRLEKTPDA